MSWYQKTSVCIYGPYIYISTPICLQKNLHDPKEYLKHRFFCTQKKGMKQLSLQQFSARGAAMERSDAFEELLDSSW